jgi:DNA-binding transcriptional regulator of glucitol operon
MPGQSSPAYRGPVWRFVLARRWWVGHVLVVLCCALFIRLGRLQWDRSQSPTGGWQNLGYALQWPLFAVVLLAAWARFLWLERQAQVPSDEPVPVPDLTPAVPRRAAHPPIPEDDPDDELAAYNAFLARLAEQDRQ